MGKTIYCIYDGENKATHEVRVEGDKWYSACAACAKQEGGNGREVREIAKPAKAAKVKKMTAAQLKAIIEDINVKINEKTIAVLEARLKTIEEDVNDTLDKHLNQIVLSAIGFSNSFGRLEVDHCNGRKTAVANQIGDMAMSMLAKTDYQKWFEQVQMDKTQLMAMKEAVQKEFKNQVSENLRHNMYEKVKARAVAEVDQLIDVLTKEDIEKLVEKAFYPDGKKRY